MTPPVTADGKTNWLPLYLGFGAMVLGQFMAILDIQIVAAALPQIQAGLGASTDEISWIQTAYLIPEVVMIPLSGYLSRIWGTQKVFLASCLGFILMSVLAGLSVNIDMMIITRALQGFIGGAMIPTVFAVAFTAFPPEKRMTTSMIMGMIVTLAPTVGPTLGGHITEWLNWRWLFFINVIPGVVVLFAVHRWANFDKGDPSLKDGFDWWGLLSMAVFLMSTQYVLEEGSKNDWFSDDAVLGLAILAALSGAAFIWRQLSYFRPIVDLHAFRNRNFTTGIVITAVTGMTMYASIFVLPLYLGSIRHFTPAQTGTTLALSGIVMFLSGPILARLLKVVDPRLAMCVGFFLAAAGMWEGHALTAEWGFAEFALLQCLRSVGIMTAMFASQTVTMATLPPSMIKNASGLVNLSRNVGGAVGLAITSTIISRNTAEYYAELSSRVTSASVSAQSMIAGLGQRMEQMGSLDPAGAGRKAFSMMMREQALILAYGDAFAFLAIACACASVISLLAARPPKAAMARPGAGEPEMAH